MIGPFAYPLILPQNTSANLHHYGVAHSLTCLVLFLLLVEKGNTVLKSFPCFASRILTGHDIVRHLRVPKAYQIPYEAKLTREKNAYLLLNKYGNLQVA